MALIKDILDYLNSENISFEFQGDDSIEVNGFSSLGNYKPKTMTWLKAEKNVPISINYSDILLIVKQKGVKAEFSNMIITEASKKTFFSVIEHFFSKETELPKIGEGTFISQNVELGENVKIGHNCTLDGNIVIGDNTIIYHNVTIINRTSIGKNCVIQSGVSIGHDGFGYIEDGNHKKAMLKHYGGTIIEDNVYIGSNCYIERGTLDDTIIGKGCKIDGLCLIGHNSTFGEDVATTGNSIIYGSVILEDNTYIAGGLIKNQITVGKDAFIGLGSVVTKDVPDNETVVGVPAKTLKK